MRVPAFVEAVWRYVALADKRAAQMIYNFCCDGFALAFGGDFDLHHAHKRVVNLTLLSEAEIPEGDFPSVRKKGDGAIAVFEVHQQATDVFAHGAFVSFAERESRG